MSLDDVAARGTGEAQGRRAIPRAKARAAAGGLSDEGAGSGFKRAAAIGASTALLFLGYLRVSWTVGATSDGAALALQARDMLAGNWLLHGWTLSDVSFYTTELPEYVLVEAVRPFGLGVIHVAAAATYTLLVLVVIALARGRAGGRSGILRGAVAGAIMLAPQLGYGAFVLLLSPDHVGTQVPLLVGWLLLDLGPRRWWVPTVLCLLLAVVQFADRVAVLTAVLPLIVVCGVTAARRRPRKSEVDARRGADGLSGRRAGGMAGHRTGGRPERVGHRADGLGRRRAGGAARAWARVCWFELALVAAGVLSVGVAWAAARVLAAAGGFAGHPFPLTVAPLSLLWTHAWLTGWGVLELYGGNFIGVTGWAGFTFAVLHLIGLSLAIVSVVVVLLRFLGPNAGQRVGAVAHNAKRPLTRGWEPGPRAEGRAPLVDSVLAVAVVANLVSYLLSTAPGTVLGTGYDAREIAAVLPLGAVLAGRVFGTALAGATLRGVPDGAVPGGAALNGAMRGGRVFGNGRGWGRGRGQLTKGAESTDRSKISIFISFTFFLVIAGYVGAFGYSAAQGAVPGQESVLASWLAGHGLRYGLGGSSANVVTVDSGGLVDVMPVAVRAGRVRALLYQTPEAAYDPRLHDANFLVTGVPGGSPGETAQTAPAAAVRATFGPPARSYRFDGYTVLVWRVNLLTRMRE
jgi:hypothetical protein